MKEGSMATKNDTVRARIDPELKERAAHVLGAMGLTVSDAIRLMLMRVAADEALPFPVEVPNATTRAAIREAREGRLRSFDSTDELMADLNAPD
jgi:DNA-damage-inducible protein J